MQAQTGGGIEPEDPAMAGSLSILSISIYLSLVACCERKPVVDDEGKTFVARNGWLSLALALARSVCLSISSGMDPEDRQAEWTPKIPQTCDG